MKIELKKKYPHIPDEDVTEIFNDGYIKGFENGRKNAIPIEYIEKKLSKLEYDISWGWYYGASTNNMEYTRNWVRIILLEEWEKENENS